jgi:hypothetical protein
MGGVSASPTLEHLRGLVASVGSRSAGAVSTGWPAFDAHLSGGLALGAVHEWIGARPPLFLLLHLARRALAQRLAADREGAVLFVGRRVFPYPAALVHAARIEEVARRSTEALLSIEVERGAHAECRDLFERSFFVDPPDEGTRLWAADAALRSKAVAALVADGGRLSIASTRRLQLAAREGEALALVARPLEEARALSAATTRSLVRAGGGERWGVELLRAKPVLRD